MKVLLATITLVPVPSGQLLTHRRQGRCVVGPQLSLLEPFTKVLSFASSCGRQTAAPNSGLVLVPRLETQKTLSLVDPPRAGTPPTTASLFGYYMQSDISLV